MKNPQSPSKVHILVVSAGALLVGIFLWSTLNTFAFVGPTANPPTGNGAVNSDSSNNVFIGGNLNVTGTIAAAGGLGGSVISAGNVSNGQFGSNVFGGNYSFPASVAIGTTTPATALDVNGDITDRNLLSKNCIGTNATGTLVVGSCAGATGANPTGQIGTTAVNGSATTFMRSDGAPAINTAATFSFSALGNTTSTGNITAASMDITGAATTASTIQTTGSIGKCASSSVTISGATSSVGAVFVAPVTYPGVGLFWQGYVSAANTVVIMECAATTTTVTASKFNAVYIY